MHELFEHTADLGLRAEADDLSELFREMGHALMAAMLDNPESVEPSVAYPVEISGEDREYLLFDWLRELLRLAESDSVLFSKFDLTLTGQGLIAIAWGEPLDRLRHHLSREVKAITYHGLTIEPHAGGWRAEVIVDI
jgi:SHS2 domain-containing protein